MLLEYVCLDCKHVFASDALLPICERCGGWVEVHYSKEKLLDFWKKLPEKGKASFLDRSMWKYRDILPIKNHGNIISMGSEGNSSVIHLDRLGKELGHSKIYFRDERKGTGTFKDMAASMFISFLKERNVKAFVVASTGNIGTAYAAYAARSGIKMYVCVPESTSIQVPNEISSYGASIIVVQGDYAAAKKFAKELAKKNSCGSDFSTRCPIRWEAKKTMAYAEFEALGDLPDVYIQAISGGTGIIGYAKGVKELQFANKTQKNPRLFGIQSEACAPMANAYMAGNDTSYKKIDDPKTAITTLATGDPQAYSRIAPLIRRSGGGIMAVPEETADYAAILLGRLEGILVDPATAIALSGLLFSIRKGKISPDETVVLNGGATILRSPQFMERINGYVNFAEKPEEVIFGKKKGDMRFEKALTYFQNLE